MVEDLSSKPTRGFWIISVVALVWNLIGVMTYLMEVTMSPETLAAMPEAERMMYADIPAWSTSAYAIAVFGGTLAAIGLLVRKAWTVPLFAVSLLGIVVQMGRALFMTDMLAVFGAGSAVMPVLIVAVAAFLLWFSISVKQKGWLS